MKCAMLAVTVTTAAAQCDLNAVFVDMRDGTGKNVTISGKSMTIKPSLDFVNQWVVNTEFDCNTLQAAVDFNVPGKADSSSWFPPVPTTVTLWTSVSAKSHKSTFIYTDPSKTLVGDPTFPLNQWVALGEDMVMDGAAMGFICPQQMHSIFAQMLPGNMSEALNPMSKEWKRSEVTIDGESMTIQPIGQDEEWAVTQKLTLDRKTCSASGVFHFPDYRGPLLATFWQDRVGKATHSAIEFTDLDGSWFPAWYPVNRWIEISAAEQHI